MDQQELFNRIAKNIAQNIAVANTRDVSDDYLLGATDTLVQVLMEIDYRLGLREAQLLAIQSITKHLDAQEAAWPGTRRPMWQQMSDNATTTDMEIHLRFDDGESTDKSAGGGDD